MMQSATLRASEVDACVMICKSAHIGMISPMPEDQGACLSLPTLASIAPSLLLAQDPQREKEIGDLLGTLTGNDYDRLVALGKRITDYSAAEAAAAVAEPAEGDALDDEIGVAVEFEGDDEEEDSEGDEVVVSTSGAAPRQLPGCSLSDRSFPSPSGGVVSAFCESRAAGSQHAALWSLGADLDLAQPAAAL